MGLEPWPDASQGERRVINVDDWAEIRRLHRAENMSIKAIVRHVGVSRNTVRAALRTDTPPRYERAAKGSIVDAVEAGEWVFVVEGERDVHTLEGLGLTATTN